MGERKDTRARVAGRQHRGIAFANGLSVTPEIRIVDQKGIMAYAGPVDDYSRSEGDPRTARNFVREALGNLLGGKEVREDNTQIQHGCPIKNHR